MHSHLSKIKIQKITKLKPRSSNLNRATYLAWGQRAWVGGRGPGTQTRFKAGQQVSRGAKSPVGRLTKPTSRAARFVKAAEPPPGAATTEPRSARGHAKALWSPRGAHGPCEQRLSSTNANLNVPGRRPTRGPRHQAAAAAAVVTTQPAQLPPAFRHQHRLQPRRCLRDTLWRTRRKDSGRMIAVPGTACPCRQSRTNTNYFFNKFSRILFI